MHLESLGLWCQEKEQKLINSTRKELFRVFGEAEKKSKPHWKELFTDVYKETPEHIRSNLVHKYRIEILPTFNNFQLQHFLYCRKQMNLMEKHLEEFKEHYPLSSYTYIK